MNTLGSELVLNQLLALQRQLACFRDHRAQLYAAHGTGDVTRTMGATQGVHRALQDLSATFASLRRLVVGMDAAVMGDTVGSFEELALRGQTLVVAAELAEVARALATGHPAAEASEDRAELFAGELRCVADVIAFVAAAMLRVNAAWIADRVGESPSSGSGESQVVHIERTAAYREVIRARQRAMGDIGRDPDLAAFLRRGAARVDSSALSAACAKITIALQLTFDAAPDLSSQRTVGDPMPACGRVTAGAS